MLAWHFSAADMKLRYHDGRTIVPGEILRIGGPPRVGYHGLHGCEYPLTALQYAPIDGGCLCKVWLGGEVVNNMYGYRLGYGAEVFVGAFAQGHGRPSLALGTSMHTVRCPPLAGSGGGLPVAPDGRPSSAGRGGDENSGCAKDRGMVVGYCVEYCVAVDDS